MAGPSNYSPELRARAVRMVAELTPDYPSQYAAISAVAKKLGIGTAETLSARLHAEVIHERGLGALLRAVDAPDSAQLLGDL